MSLNIYQEAIVEAKQLKEMAEQNAKNKIIEAITPRIRKLIEQELVDIEEDDLADLVVGDAELEELPPVADEDEEALDLSMLSMAEPAPELAPKIKIDVAGDINLELEGDDDEEEDLILGREVVEALERALNINTKRGMRGRIVFLNKKVKNLREAINGVDMRKLRPLERKIATLYYAKILQEAISLLNNDILMTESVDLRLMKQLKNILKEINNMSRRKDAAAFRRLFEELAGGGLGETGMYEQDEELDLDVDVEEEVEVEETAPEDVDVPAAQDAVSDLAVALGLEVVEEEEVDEEVEVEEEELDLEEGDDVDEQDDALDEVFEIDERAIRRELVKLRRLRESDATDADPSLNHGGEDEGDLFIDVDEDTLLNALADELGDPSVPTPKVGAGGGSVAESRRRRRAARRGRTPSRNRGATRQVQEARRRTHRAEKAAHQLKRQLNEMNLFNAKLLFANKLMQNRGLSTKQQRVIVEALDNAKTIREAKLLYKSLSRSLNTNRTGSTLTENRSRLLASSSRSTRSGSPANSGAEVDRWAVLAGLNDPDKS